MCLFRTSCLISTAVILVQACRVQDQTFLDSSYKLVGSPIMTACPQQWITQVKIASYNRSMHY